MSVLITTGHNEAILMLFLFIMNDFCQSMQVIGDWDWIQFKKVIHFVRIPWFGGWLLINERKCFNKLSWADKKKFVSRTGIDFHHENNLGI